MLLVCCVNVTAMLPVCSANFAHVTRILQLSNGYVMGAVLAGYVHGIRM